jgi:type II secretory pathway pseudopilin PulG
MELAVVMAIVALLLGGLLVTLAAQNATREITNTQRTLEQARDAIIGFMLRAERLPCPAAGGATGVEAFVNAGPTTPIDLSCAVPLNGFVPALTLGIGPTDAQGYLVDAWGNRIRYSVSQWPTGSPNPTAGSCPPLPPAPAPVNPGPLNYTQCPAFTTAGAMKGVGLNTLPNTFPGLLRVCDVAACTGQAFTTPAVLVSPGKNFAAQVLAGTAGAGDEEANAHFTPPADGTFVAHEPRPAGAPGGQFDDLVLWISPNILYNRLISAGAI